MPPRDEADHADALQKLRGWRRRLKKHIKKQEVADENCSDNAGPHSDAVPPPSVHVTLLAHEKCHEEAPSSESHNDREVEDSPVASPPVAPSTLATEPYNAGRQSLWARAIASVEADPDFAELAKRYRVALAPPSGRQQDGDEPADERSPASDETIQKTAKELLDKVPDTYLTCKFGKSEKSKLVVRKQVRNVVKWVLSCKDVIGAAISAEPHAALIWAGVLVVLLLLERIFQQDEDAASGFEWLSSLLVELHVVEESIVSPKSSTPSTPASERLVAELEKHMVAVYKIIYRYQVQLIVHFVQTKWRRTAKNLTATNWKEMTDDAKAQKAHIDQEAHNLFGSRMMEATDRIKAEMDENLQATLKGLSDLDESHSLSQLPCVGEAAYDSAANKQQRTCLEGTQHETLRRIREWVEDPEGKLVCWLHGLAGTGKSSIAQTVATCLDNGLAIGAGTEGALSRDTCLGASFFLRQGDSQRNHLATMFPTIAVSLAQQNSTLQKHIADAVRKDRMVGSKVLSEQLKNLILEPLTKLEDVLPAPVRLVVVMDALDECVDPEDTDRMLRLLPSLRGLRRAQIRFFITSRLVPHIQKAMPGDDMLESMVLDKVSQHEAEDLRRDDITLLITQEMGLGTSNHEQKPPQQGWISPEEIHGLVARSDGLFIYAATICRFLGGDLPQRIRKDRIQHVLRREPRGYGPEAKLSEIYTGVLSFPFSRLNEDEMKEKYACVRDILGVVACVIRPVPITALTSLLKQYENGMDKDEIKSYLDELQSIVSIPRDESRVVEFFHLSFRDFLVDEKRATPDFFIDEAATHRCLLDACLGVMEEELRQDMCNLHLPGSLVSDIPPQTISKCISPQLQYACLHWVNHLEKLDDRQRRLAGLVDHGRVHKFLLSKFLFWLEARSLLGAMPESILAIHALQELTRAIDAPEVGCFLDDARRFTLTYRYIIERAPLQTYISALVLSPTSSIVRTTFQNLVPEWIRVSGVEEQWGPEILTLQGHRQWIHSISVSSDNSTIASASDDGTARLWDIVTGAEKLCIGELSPIRSIAFSPDDKTIIYGVDDGTIRFRSITTGETTVLDGRTQFYSTVHSLPFGPFDRYDQYGNENLLKSLQLWDAQHQRYLETVDLTDKIPRGHVSFGGSLLAVAYTRCRPEHMTGGVLLWDIDSGKSRDVKLPYRGKCVYLSKCGKTMAVASLGLVQVLDTITANVLYHVEVESEYSPCIAFSAELHMLAIGSRQSIMLYDIRPGSSRTPISTLSSPENFAPVSMHFSANGLLLSGEVRSSIRVWDTATVLGFHGGTNSISDMWVLPCSELTLLVLQGRQAKVWDAKTSTSRPFVENRRPMNCEPSGTVIKGQIVALRDDIGDAGIEFWNGDLTELLKTLDSSAQRCVFSDDGQMVVLLENLGNSPRLRVLSTQTWNEKVVFETLGVVDNFSLQISTETRILIWLRGRKFSFECQVHIGDLETGVELAEFSDARRPRLSPNGKMLAFERRVLGEDDEGETHIVDTRTGKTKYIFPGEKATFDHQGKYLIVLSRRWKRHTVVELATGKTVRTSRNDNFRDEMRFSRTGRVVAWGSGGLCVWDANGIEAGNYDARVIGENPRISDDETHLVGLYGKYPLPLANAYRPSDGLPKEARDCLYLVNKWVVQGFSKILWLPPGCLHKIAIRDATIVIRLSSGQIVFLEFDLDRTPVATGWDVDGDEDCLQEQ